VTEEATLDSLPPDERARMRKQLGDQAVRLAISSRWDEAVSINRQYISLFGEDADVLNRLGKALSEVGQVTEARKQYSRSLELDSTNTIARRNLDRLAAMTDSAAAGAAPSQLDTRLFVEESGKAAVATLQAVDEDRRKHLDAGDVVELQVQGNAVNVVTKAGDYVGMVEPRIGLRMAKMMVAGNQYTAAMVTAGEELRVMLRETYQHPSQIGRVSFPQARMDYRGYTRRGLIRGEELEYGEDDEAEDDEPEDGWSETSDEIESGTVDVDVETEDESFD
jgi:tetratricopeptide (TPR) repeat protein